MEILNDKESGEENMARARDLGNVKQNNHIFIVDGLNGEENEIASFSTDGTPCIYVTGDLEKIG